jgi:acyl carrier protein
MTEVKAVVKNFVLEKFLTGTDSGELQDDTPLFHFGILDSYNVLVLIKFLENSFQISVAAREIDARNFDSLNLIETFVKGKLLNRTGAARPKIIE